MALQRRWLLAAPTPRRAVSGVEYHQFLTARVLQPLEMTDTRFLRPLEVRRQRATHYERGSTKNLQVYPYLLTDWDLWNDLGMSITDFARWAAALDSGRLLRPAGFNAMWSPAVLGDGKPVQFRALTESFNSYGFRPAQGFCSIARITREGDCFYECG